MAYLPRLDDKPVEIITIIVGFLPAPPPEIGERRPVVDNQLAPDTPWFDFIQSRRNLYNMCLVSRGLSDIARPLLYRIVPIWHEAAMVPFFRTLCDKPEYGLWTRYFACHITLTIPSVIQKFYDLFYSAPGASALITPGPNALITPGPNLPQVLLCIVLLCLTKVKTVLLQVPVTDDQSYDALCAEINAIKDKPHASPFQHVDTLLLQGDPDPPLTMDDDDDDDDERGVQPHHYVPLCASFPNLTTLQVSSDTGVWSDNTLPPNIRHIYLYNSGAYSWGLSSLLRNAPKLETLYMAPRDANSLDEFIDDNTDDNNTYDADPEALDIALANHGKHLRVLDIRWDGFTGRKRFIGQDGRLTSLANMESLHLLSVQMALLYGKPSAVLGTPLINLLPPNLVELIIEDWWWANVKLLDELPDWGPQERADYYQTQHHYRVSVVSTLMEFARDVRQRLHRLEKVIFLCTIRWAWVPEQATSLESHFENIKTTFLEQEVEFSVESGVEEWGGSMD